MNDKQTFVETFGTQTDYLNIPSGLGAVIAISAGCQHNVALLANRTVVAWGSNSYGQTNVPTGLSGCVSISAGGFHSIALKSDGTVVVWETMRMVNSIFHLD